MSEGTFRTAGMVVSVALAAAIVLAAVVLLLRDGDNVPIQILPPGPESGGTNSASTADGDVKVYISGAVRNPGGVPDAARRPPVRRRGRRRRSHR